MPRTDRRAARDLAPRADGGSGTPSSRGVDLLPVAVEAQFAPSKDDPLRTATPAVDDVEARRARAAVEGRLFSGPAKRVKVGRYRVEGKIGAGGMGVVYRAHDPELARDVALKLLNTDTITDAEATRARGRLVREARAMARLAHPNVIHVYDVGTVEDGVFIAMELVDGDPFSVWLEREHPAWRETLQRYLDAGEGLAAAHEAGVIHRDFKPENVMLGTDGRVRVGDFGLAGGPGSETGRHDIDPSDRAEAEVDKESVTNSLTRTGALLGTPKYMAPEQEMGLSATARSDQFGFCVALYEGLYGQPPYGGKTVLEYRRQVSDEEIREPGPSEVPPWVFEVLRKGLRRDPVERHPSMRFLLDRLGEALVETDPQAVLASRRRRGAGAWIGMLGVGIGLAVGIGFAMESDDPVAVGSERVEGDSEARAVLAENETKGRDPTAPLQPGPSRVMGSAGPVTGDGPSPSEATEPPPSPPPPRVSVEVPEVEPSPNGPPDAPKARRKRGQACYYRGDGRKFLHVSKQIRKRRVSTFIHANTCYSCREPSAYIKSTLSPDAGVSCRSSDICHAVDRKECDS